MTQTELARLTELTRLLDRLDNKEETLHDAVLQQLQRISPESYPDLLDFVSKQESQQNASYSTILLLIATVFLPFAAMHGVFAIFCVGLLLFIPGVVSSVHACRKSAFHNLRYVRVCRLLGAAAERQTGRGQLPALLTLVSLRTQNVAASAYLPNTLPVEIKRGVRNALRHTIPGMDIEAYRALTLDQKGALVSLLREPFLDPPLTLAILNKLGEMCDPYDVEFETILSSLAKGSAVTANMQQVQSAARAAIRRLGTRRDQARQARSLLRASDAPLQPASNILLRPVSNVTTEAVEQLLRASEKAQGPS